MPKFREACLRCPVLQVDPKMLARLDEIEAELLARRERAASEGWHGEIEGLDLTCAEHVLDLFESAHPEDPRPRQAIEYARAWVRGEVTMMQARPAAMPWGRPETCVGSTACRVRSRSGRGGRARRRARTRCSRLCDQGRTCRRAGGRGRGRGRGRGTA